MKPIDKRLKEILTNAYGNPVSTSDEGTSFYWNDLVIEEIKQVFREDLGEELKSSKGKDCECCASGYSDCGCGADWDDNDNVNKFRKELLERWK